MNPLAQKILKEMKAGKYAPVYILQGEETYYIDLISDYIEAHALEDQEKDFNQTILYGNDTTVSTVLHHAKRFPVMADRQVIMVKEAQEIPDIQKGAGADLLLNYLSHPNPSTVLVLCYKHKSLDKRGTLGKQVNKLAVSAVFNRLYENQLPQFIRTYMQDKGYTIEEAGVHVLSEHVGNDLKRMVSEIEKILISADQNKTISAEEIMLQIGVSRHYNIFELQGALIQRDKAKVNTIIEHFNSNPRKNPAIPIVAFLYSFYSKLLVASTISGCNETKLVSLLKISPFSARNYLLALRHYSGDKIQRSIQYIAEADLRLKGIHIGTLNEGQILKELTYLLMH